MNYEQGAEDKLWKSVPSRKANRAVCNPEASLVKLAIRFLSVKRGVVGTKECNRALAEYEA